VLLLVTALVWTRISNGQTSGPPPAQLAEMKKLELLEGNWSGEGWMQRGPTRSVFVSSEKVEGRLSGLVIIIEGLHHEKMPGGAKGPVVHNAVATVSYDAASGAYKFAAHQGDGRYVDATGKLVAPGHFEWGFKSPQGMVRFTIKFGADNWNETGEYSSDGKSWTKFFEMNLHRVK
jgi:hypothetical protein